MNKELKKQHKLAQQACNKAWKTFEKIDDLMDKLSNELGQWAIEMDEMLFLEDSCGNKSNPTNS